MIYPSRPQFIEDWPNPSTRFAKSRSAKDTGVGDTVFRIFGKSGIARVVAELKSLGIACAKCHPQFWLNRLYSYNAPSWAANNKKLAALRDTGKGKTLIIVANGPSHAEAGLERLKGIERIDTMTVNRPFMPIWPTTYWTFVDPSVGRFNARIWREYSGVVLHGLAVKMYHPNAILFNASSQFETDIVRRGLAICLAGLTYGTSTLVAIQLANYFNYDRVYIFGLDMAADKDGKLYPWGSNPVCPDDQRVKRFADENSCLEGAAKALGDKAKRFTVCSSYATAAGWSFLKHFPTLPHETAVGDILAKRGSNDGKPIQ